MSLRILWKLPRGLQARVLWAVARRRHPEPIVAGEPAGGGRVCGRSPWVPARAAAGLPLWLLTTQAACPRPLETPPFIPLPAGAVADPQVMGYLQLYILLLERAKRRLATALRLCAHRGNLPLLVHCIHGGRRRRRRRVRCARNCRRGCANCTLNTCLALASAPGAPACCRLQFFASNVLPPALLPHPTPPHPCAGKDRTGLVAMLLLLLCGAEHEASPGRQLPGCLAVGWVAGWGSAARFQPPAMAPPRGRSRPPCPCAQIYITNTGMPGGQAAAGCGARLCPVRGAVAGEPREAGAAGAG